MAWFTKDRPAGNDVGDFDNQIRCLIAKHTSNDVVEAGNDAIKIGDVTTNLGNLRRAWSEQAPVERIPWLERTVIAFVKHEPIPDTLDTSQLRPGVRSRTTFELAGVRLGLDTGGFADGSTPAMQPIAADLTWVLIWDTPATMGTINAAQLDDWGMSFDELLHVAKSNLAMEPFLGWKVAHNNVYSPTGVDDYDGTRVFLPGALDFLPFDDERVVFQPTRTTCHVVSASNAEGIATAAVMALEELESAHQVSFTPVIGRDDIWRPLVLEQAHPAYSAWRKLITIDKLYGYEAQKVLLEEQLGDELFIAKFSAVESDVGQIKSYCTWSKGVATLLPVADVVALYTGDCEIVGEEAFMIPWDAAIELVGHLIEPTNHYPIRFRVLDFPTDAELDILRSLAIDL